MCFVFLQVIEKNSKPHIQVDTSQGTKVFAPEEISAMVLLKMKETAEAYLGTKVIITRNISFGLIKDMSPF